jgi:molybdopterin-guanine dinucleotide biosynthesis protein A
VPTEDVTAIILAGGRASRLGGVDKAALEIGGETVLDRVLKALGNMAGPVLAIVNDDRLDADTRLTVIHDPEPHAGVLPALLAALDAATTPLAVLVACDMPFLDAGLLAHLVDRAAQCDAVIPLVDGRPEPMHAVYRVEPCRAAIRDALARDQRRMISFLDQVRTCRVEEGDLRQFDPELRSFFNVNTPEDLDAARRRVDDRSR